VWVWCGGKKGDLLHKNKNKNKKQKTKKGNLFFHKIERFIDLIEAS